MWKGQISFETPDAVRGRLPGDLPVRRPDRRHPGGARRWTSTSPTRYFVVAHFHYVLFGTIVFATYAGIYFWFPKMTGRFLDERLGKLHFWTTFIGFHMTFLVQHWLGNMGMPRRYPDYLPTDGFTFLNTFSTIGCVHPRRLDAAVHLERHQVLAVRRGHHRGRPVGLRQLAGVGDQLPAAAAQLHLAAADPLRAAGVRAASPAHVERMRSEAHPHRDWTAARRRPRSASTCRSEHTGP